MPSLHLQSLHALTLPSCERRKSLHSLNAFKTAEQKGEKQTNNNNNMNKKKVLMSGLLFNRPFPSSTQPSFESKAKCKVCYENQFSFIMKLELITITKISHLDSPWKRDCRELGNGLFFWQGISWNGLMVWLIDRVQFATDHTSD